MNKKSTKKTRPKTPASEGRAMSTTGIESGSVLSAKQLTAITSLVAGSSQLDAAKIAKVDERTIRRWLHTPLFMGELRKSESDVLAFVNWKMSQGIESALETVSFLRDKSESDPTRLAAAFGWMDRHLKYRDALFVEERLKILELALLKK